MSKILLICLILFISNIFCMDINLILGKKFEKENNTYPVTITLSEPLSKSKTPIDLYCIFDSSSKMDEFNLKRTLNFIMDSLDNNDKLTLIKLFSNGGNNFYSDIIITNESKINASNMIEEIVLGGDIINFESINKIIDGINKRVNNSRISSVIFMSAKNNNDNDDYIQSSIINFEHTINTLGFNFESNGKRLLELSELKYGRFYFINNFEKAKKAVLEIINDAKSIKYKSVNITIELDNKHIFKTIYGYKHISNYTFKPKNITFKIKQFMTGKNYSYVFLVNLEDDIQCGNRILRSTVNFENQTKTNYLDFYNSVNYFDFQKNELCRVRAIEAIDRYLNNKYNKKKYNKVITRIIKDCKSALNKKLYNAINGILDSYEKSNWMYETISEFRLFQN